MSTGPYYQDDLVTLYHGDCREITAWLDADVLVTDPPYGRAIELGSGLKNSAGQGRARKQGGMIIGDQDTEARDRALTMWGSRRLSVVFGDLLIAQPIGAVQTLIYAKSSDAGIRGARGGFRRDAEAIYLCGPWPAAIGGRTSIIHTNGRVATPRGVATITGHPHAKPMDVMATLITACPSGVVADPFAGSGSTLLAAKFLGRRCVAVEVEERYCEITARRLDQGVLDFGEAS